MRLPFLQVLFVVIAFVAGAQLAFFYCSRSHAPPEKNAWGGPLANTVQWNPLERRVEKLRNAGLLLYGHLHMAKTAGTSVNVNFSLTFERVCGHKGYSYDAWRTNLRVRKAGGNVSNQTDLLALVPGLGAYSRARVHESLMDEIGFEDCDWISHETAYPFWTRFQVPLELHVPCRDPIDHLLSQCNHLQREFACDGDLVNETKKCLIEMNRFNRNLTRWSNFYMKCYDWRAGFDGRYLRYMSDKLQRRRKQGASVFRATNHGRGRDACLLTAAPSVRNKVKDWLVKSQDYYGFCNRCIGSKNDLFQHQRFPA